MKEFWRDFAWWRNVIVGGLVFDTAVLVGIAVILLEYCR